MLFGLPLSLSPLSSVTLCGQRRLPSSISGRCPVWVSLIGLSSALSLIDCPNQNAPGTAQEQWNRHLSVKWWHLAIHIFSINQLNLNLEEWKEICRKAWYLAFSSVQVLIFDKNLCKTGISGLPHRVVGILNSWRAGITTKHETRRA